MNNIDLKGNPFYLDEADIKWVNDTKSNMTLEEKIGQLFFLMGFTTKKKELQEVVTKIKPGGMMYRTSKANKVAQAHKVLQENSKIPMLLAANLEAGGNGLIEEGTYFGNQMMVAASDNEENAYKLGLIAGREASSVGGNMAFAPIIDINFNFRNPITNTRSFGDDPKRVAKMGAAYVKGAQAANLSVTIKHFPGDGVDGRDQHLLTTHNTLSYEHWMETFGHAYRTCIEAGARGLMVGHMSLPSYMDRVKPGDEKARLTPATLNKDLIEGLLRKELKYNGLTMTDASLMTGFGENGKREDLVPLSIAAGCDMFLFTRQPEDDFNFMLKGYRKGIITEKRLDEALTRILAMKASLGLHKMSQNQLVPNNFKEINKSEHEQWAKQLADQSVTLVKDNQKLLPLNPNKHKKIGVIYNANASSMTEIFKNIPGVKGAAIRTMMGISKLMGKGALPPHELFIQKLRENGFEAFHYDFGDIFSVMKDSNKPLSVWKSQFDVIIYLCKWETMSNQTSLQINYKAMGFDAPWFVHEVPTMLVSIANPYHGYDLPMIQTVVNGYTPNGHALEAIVDKITGKSAFKGVSPVCLEYKEFEGAIKINGVNQ